MVIEFGDWQLRPLDGRNWELYHRHAASKGKDKGSTKWHRCGKYYSYNTLENALMFAADVELKSATGTLSASEFLEGYRRMLAEFSEALSESLRTSHSPASQ